MLSEGLTWNANGSLQQLTLGDKCQVQTCSYAHDDLSRIASVACTGNTWSENFSYDPFGNISMSGTVQSWQATYNESTNRIQTIPGASASYDAKGNLLHAGPAGGGAGATPCRFLTTATATCLATAPTTTLGTATGAIPSTSTMAA